MRYFISLLTPRASHLLMTPLYSYLNALKNDTEFKNNLHCLPLMISRPQGLQETPNHITVVFYNT